MPNLMSRGLGAMNFRSPESLVGQQFNIAGGRVKIINVDGKEATIAEFNIEFIDETGKFIETTVGLGYNDVRAGILAYFENPELNDGGEPEVLTNIVLYEGEVKKRGKNAPWITADVYIYTEEGEEIFNSDILQHLAE